MFLTILILSGALFPIPPSEARFLLWEMDAKIVAAKTLRIDFEVHFPPDFIRGFSKGPVPGWTTAGSLVLGERNRFRGETWLSNPGTLSLTVSDGKRSGGFNTGTGKLGFGRVPDWHNETLKVWLGRGGTLLALAQMDRYQSPSGKPPGPGDGPKTAHHSLLPDEVIDGVRCRVVRYELELDWIGQKPLMRVWIDAATALPVRRELTLFPGRGQDICTAVHTRFEIDQKLDDGLFDLPTEADVLLAQMDAKIRSAKSLRIESEIRMGGEKRERVMNGSVVLADRNRFRIEADSDGPVVIVSDGKRMVKSGSGQKDEDPVPAWHNEVLQSWLGRGGTLMSVAALWQWSEAEDGRRPGSADGPRVAGARLLPDADVNGVKTRVVEYDLIWGGRPTDFGKAKVQVWIDPKTKLPIRQKLVFRNGILEGTWTATHTKFEIDPKLDDKLFELPK